MSELFDAVCVPGEASHDRTTVPGSASPPPRAAPTTAAYGYLAPILALPPQYAARLGRAPS
ncbi:hypothetical protein [Streptomyces pilosus]|uniref:Uncharacterized protein n=1 Tax=Streptomyces pilosus TaxID=28893 RepID=A0A918F7Z0_9ACTN|nr:hypothetical protein [Streptomyces pilosus]GGR09843.1 hypothetical protein GCM10010280_66960 [Streptomyces pilosus]